MGSTLEHGIYLPSEGEKNCYQGLAGNWNKVDGALGDIAELKQSIESKFTKEIVTELPTEDINPFCIYMILKTDPETDNIYDEWVYINNSWEYLGNTKVDMTQYYTKQEVNQLPAVASGVTATKVGNYDTHIANGDIHVTASDKTKWTNSANTHVLRLALSALTPSTSNNSFSNLDDSTALKVGDKVMDTAGVLFEVTAIDTQNSTFTIGTALVDLAQDSDVVHKSGNEIVGGEKTFANNKLIVGRNTDTGSAIQFVNADVVGDSANGSSGFEVYGSSISDANKIGSITIGEFSNNGGSYATIECNRTVSGVKSSNAIRSLIRPNGLKELSATVDNDCKLGTEFLRWSKIYGTEYYYGSNNVEFSTKFVTTDTNQTISGNKTFSDNLTIYNSDDTVTPKGLTIKNAQWGMGESGATTVSNINFLDKNSSIPVSIMASKGASGQSFLRFSVRTKDSQNTTYLEEIYYVVDTSGNVDFRPWHDNSISLGTSIYRWKDFYTNKINGLEPSSLGMPSDRSARIDISSYITNLGNGDTNAYTVPANGYIWLHFTSVTGIICYSQTSSTMTNYAQTFTRSQGDGQLYAFFPVRKDDRFVVQIYTSSTGVVQNAYFIPCQGNV